MFVNIVTIFFSDIDITMKVNDVLIGGLTIMVAVESSQGSLPWDLPIPPPS